MVTTATVRGQVVIPAEVRKKLGIKKGTRLHVEVDERTNRIILRPITRRSIRAARGMFKGKGLLEALMRERKEERLKEERKTLEH